MAENRKRKGRKVPTAGGPIVFVFLEWAEQWRSEYARTYPERPPPTGKDAAIEFARLLKLHEQITFERTGKAHSAIWPLPEAIRRALDGAYGLKAIGISVPERIFECGNELITLAAGVLDLIQKRWPTAKGGRPPKRQGRSLRIQFLAQYMTDREIAKFEEPTASGLTLSRLVRDIAKDRQKAASRNMLKDMMGPLRPGDWPPKTMTPKPP